MKESAISPQLSTDEYRAMWKLLIRYKTQLMNDLRSNDYSLIESVAYSKRQQIEAIDTLFDVLQYRIEPQTADAPAEPR